jgi:hypothetical protein
MSEVKRRLADALRAIAAAIDNYLEDAVESESDEESDELRTVSPDEADYYDLDSLVPIPRTEPKGYNPKHESNPTFLAWRIKLAVAEAKNLYLELTGKRRLPARGRRLFQRFRDESRHRRPDAAAIYNLAEKFGDWAKSEAAQFASTTPSGRLSEAEERIVNVLREAGERMSTMEILTALENKDRAVSQGTTKVTLATLVRRGILTNRRDVDPPGYGLQE